MRFVGLDLAWSPRNQTGGAVVSADGRLLQGVSDLHSDGEILAFVDGAVPAGEPAIVAIDAPLAVPNETGSRPCDSHLAAVFARFEAGPYPANRRNLERYGGLRGEAITRGLEQRGFRHDPHLARQARERRVVEVFPHPAIISLFRLDKTLKCKARRGRDYAHRWQELVHLRDLMAGLAVATPVLCLPDDVTRLEIAGRRGRAFKEAEDLLDALVCAYAALHAWYHGPPGYAVYGPPQAPDADGRTPGRILVPMTPWMWKRVHLGPAPRQDRGELAGKPQ
jgi:predicted RNase H-like nuclease